MQFPTIRNSSYTFTTQVGNVGAPSTAIARTFITGFTSSSGTKEIFIRSYEISIGNNSLEIGIQVSGSM